MSGLVPWLPSDFSRGLTQLQATESDKNRHVVGSKGALSGGFSRTDVDRTLNKMALLGRLAACPVSSL